MYDLKYNDSRYNGFQIGTNTPSTRSSVKHTRELKTRPGKPHSFVPTDDTSEPVTFRRATEVFPMMWYQRPRYCRCRGDKPDSFYFEPLSASRIESPRYSLARSFLNEEPYRPISRLRIFSLPEVCVGQILSYLSGPDLASLALVDKDCRQLARARQFRSVWLNYSSASMGLLKKLVSEACDRVGTTSLEGRKWGSDKQKWTLGACIRRISIAFEPKSEKTKYKPTSWVDSRRRNNEGAEFHLSHMNALELVLQAAVPNLDFLDWKDRIPITPILTNAIINSPITKLELHSVTLTHDFDVSGGESERARRWQEKPKWQLRTLVLRLSTAFTHNGGTVVFTRSILKLAAPTLEELVWDGFLDSGEEADGWHSFGPEPIRFPKLKKLEMTRVLMADDTVLSSFLPAKDEEVKLIHLWLSYSYQGLKPGPFLAKRGHIPTLKHLNWPDFALYDDIDLCVSFISANPQLETFRLEDPAPKLADEHLVPLFASTFHNLTSLALVWETTEIGSASLALIAKIVTLKHLWLSAGKQCSMEFDWLIDHKRLRKRLRPLKELEWFALTRDYYPNGNKHFRYTHPPQSQEWEDDHRKTMVRHATAFALPHPKLEWVYFGQIPMSIERSGDDVIAVPLTQKREDCERLLSEMWGQTCDNWVYSQ